MKKAKKLVTFLLCLLIFSLSSFVSATAAITQAPTPINSEEAELKWSLKLGSSYRNSPSVPAVCGDYVYTMCRNTLYKINAQNGEIIKSAEMAGEPSFGYTPVLVADSMIFCPLEGGTVQAFELESLESLWIYTDFLSGQALSPIVYDSGYIYTGFWNDEELDANFVCLNAESGELKWSCVKKGGFYWSECLIISDYLVIGGDNGSVETNASTALQCLNKRTGETIDTAEISGDQRSGICFYEKSIYFVTKAGYLYKTSLDKNGFFRDVFSLKLSGASTSTPVIYNDRIYIGVQSSGFNGNIDVINSNTLESIAVIPMKGYPQNEVLLTTAYNNIYIYSTYNAGPGGITVISDGASPVAKDLFIPESGSKSYCISPITASNDGTLFYKNDSGTVFAVGKAEQKVEKSFFEIIIDWLKNIFDLIFSLLK